jgi:hypothetical protein
MQLELTLGERKTTSAIETNGTNGYGSKPV